MPYISQEDREFIDDNIHLIDGDDVVASIAAVVGEVPSGKIKGAINYIVSRIAFGAMQHSCFANGKSPGYTDISMAVGALTDAAEEMRRRKLNPYEDGAVKKNGDLPEYE